MHYIVNEGKHRVELFFNRIPPKHIRYYLKSNGWQWDHKFRCWYNKPTKEFVEMAAEMGASEVRIIKETVAEKKKINYQPDEIKNINKAYDPFDRTETKEPEFKYDELYRNSDKTLYIHKGRIICQQRNHRVIQATAVLSGVGSETVRLNVNFCTQCGKFFMSYNVYQQYRKLYGIILGDIKMLKKEDFSDYCNFLAEESPLRMMGYTVSSEVGLWATQRQHIIVFALEHGVMKKGEIINHLEWLINRNEHRENMGEAVRKWREDLYFTLNYNLDSQFHFKINNIIKYSPNEFVFNVR